MGVVEREASYKMEKHNEIGGSKVEWFTMNKFEESVDKWTGRSNCPTSMVNTLQREGVDDFIFG